MQSRTNCYQLLQRFFALLKLSQQFCRQNIHAVFPIAIVILCASNHLNIIQFIFRLFLICLHNKGIDNRRKRAFCRVVRLQPIELQQLPEAAIAIDKHTLICHAAKSNRNAGIDQLTQRTRCQVNLKIPETVCFSLDIDANIIDPCHAGIGRCTRQNSIALQAVIHLFSFFWLIRQYWCDKLVLKSLCKGIFVFGLIQKRDAAPIWLNKVVYNIFQCKCSAMLFHFFIQLRHAGDLFRRFFGCLPFLNQRAKIKCFCFLLCNNFIGSLI